MSSMSGRLRIDTQAIKRNYALIDRVVGQSCVTGASVKADCYGLGAEGVLPALFDQGCRDFFVATIEEGMRARKILGDGANIYILNGFWPDLQQDFLAYQLTPVLNALDDIERYNAFSKENGGDLPALLHFDTAMNRLGLPQGEAQILCDDLSRLDAINVQYVMSHFSSSDDRSAAQNAQQNERFRGITKHFPQAKYSLCNSGGVFQSSDYHFDLVRPGIALYGGAPITGEENPMELVLRLDVPVLQVHSVKAGETAGYNATYKFERDSYVAVVSLGYADGVFRSLSNNGALYWNGVRMPFRGRVSMDLIICDLCDVPQNQYPAHGDVAEFIGNHQTIDDIARDAGTISYEVITALGRRYIREYA